MTRTTSHGWRLRFGQPTVTDRSWVSGPSNKSTTPNNHPLALPLLATHRAPPLFLPSHELLHHPGREAFLTAVRVSLITAYLTSRGLGHVNASINHGGAVYKSPLSNPNANMECKTPRVALPGYNFRPSSLLPPSELFFTKVQFPIGVR